MSGFCVLLAGRWNHLYTVMWISSVNTQISQCDNIPRARMPPTMSKTTWRSLSRRPEVFVHRSKQKAEKHKSQACHLDSCSSKISQFCWSDDQQSAESKHRRSWISRRRQIIIQSSEFFRWSRGKPQKGYLAWDIYIVLHKGRDIKRTVVTGISCRGILVLVSLLAIICC